MERISRKPPPDCPLCGWSRKDHPMQTHEWTHKSGECAGEDREPCLLRQLAVKDDEIAALKAELARYTGPLTDEQAGRLTGEWGADRGTWKQRDRAIREVKGK